VNVVDMEAKLTITMLLLNEFGILVEALDPYNLVDYPIIISKIKLVEAKMIRLYYKWDNPTELLDHIQHMSSIIKKLERKQNKHVTDM
jgi:hypothetical protein